VTDTSFPSKRITARDGLHGGAGTERFLPQGIELRDVLRRENFVRASGKQKTAPNINQVRFPPRNREVTPDGGY
jgi:hypothetical protein